VPRFPLHPLACALAFALALPARASEVRDTGPAWALCKAPPALETLRTLPPDAPRARRADTPARILADRLDVSEARVTTFSGRVELLRADQWLGTEGLRYEHEAGTWTSLAPVRFEDEGLRLTAEGADGDEANDTVRLRDVTYQLGLGTEGNGVAVAVVREGERSTFADASYSTCPPGQRQWELRAATIEVDDAAGRGVAQGASLRLGGVPVMWLPWLSFPTSDARRSGLLYPRLGYRDRNGIDYAQPVYLNLAPNYDATITPRWMSRRGLMLGTEFRYLGLASAGMLEGTWLPDDELAGRDRGLFRWQHTTRLGPHWSAQALLQHVSDREYLRDFGDDLGRNALTLLPSQMSLDGRGRHWSTSLSLDRWQAANPVVAPGSEPFARLPRLRSHWQQPLLPWLELGLHAEAVRFEHEDRPGGQRLDLMPGLRLDFGGPAWFFRPELAWRYTGYSLERDPLAPVIDRSPSRSLPVASLDLGLAFERPLTLFGREAIQTLEPRLYYLRVPYRDQDALPLFDTQPLTFSWPGLFRQNRYSGADRQADANQATLAITSRLLDGEDGRERLSLSLGRVLYLDTPRVRLPGEPLPEGGGSAYVGEADWRVSDRWSLSLAQQWHPGSRGTELSALRSQWRFADRGVLNASYRYRKDLLEQADLSFTAPIDAHWRTVGRWVWSLRERRTLEALGGVEWRSCCMAVRVLARDYIRDLNAERNLGIYVEIELNGLGRFGRDSERLLSDGILGYTP